MTFKIVADSSANLRELDGAPFACAPLSIITDERQFVDEEGLDLEGMLDYLIAYKGRSGTSCPNVADWLNAFGDAEGVFAVAITSSLSGSYSTLVRAKEIYEQTHPGRRVCCLDSLSAGPEPTLIAEKLRELISTETDFDRVETLIREYMTRSKLIFVFKSMNNMARNGRVSPLVARACGILGIQIIGQASTEGTLQPLRKCRGERSALQAMLSEMEERNFRGGKVRIAHCRNSSGAVAFADLIRKKYPQCDIRVMHTTGLCSFYVEIGGMMIGYETE